MNVFLSVKRLSPESRRTFFLLSAIVCLGCLLRLYRLGDWSLWLDELWTATRIRGSLNATIQTLIPSPFPPLYYILLNLWCRVFGYSEFALRLPSAICSTVGIIFIYKLSRAMFTREIGLTAALLLALSSYSINYAQDAKQYPMIWTLGLAAFYYLYLYIERRRLRDLVVHICVVVAAVYTLYIGFLFMAIHNIVFFLFKKKDQSPRDWLIGQGLVVLLYLPWLSRFAYTARHRSGVDWVQPISDYVFLIQDLFRQMCGISLGLSYCPRKSEIIIFLILTLSAFVRVSGPGNVRKMWDFTRSTRILLLWYVVPVVLLAWIDRMVYPLFVYRYVGFIHIPIIMLISKGISQYSAPIRKVLLGAMLFYLVIFQLFPYFYQGQRVVRFDWRGFVERLETRVQRGDLVIGNFEPEMDLYYTDRFFIQPFNWKEKDLSKGLAQKPFAGHKYRSVFVVLRWADSDYKPPQGYSLQERYSSPDRRLTYLWYRQDP